MDSQVKAALIAGSVAAVGWFVSYAFTTFSNIISSKRTAALAHIEKQLEELYGPLAFLVLEGKQTFRELLDALGRNYVFDSNDKISAGDLKLWLFWAENDFMPRNLKIQTLLSEKTHLLYDSKMVASYLQFLNHHNSWMIRHLRWQKEHVEYSWHSNINFPERFTEDVLTAFSELQKKHLKLMYKTGSLFRRRV
jgi:hypothetical protein